MLLGPRLHAGLQCVYFTSHHNPWVLASTLSHAFRVAYAAVIEVCGAFD